MQQARRTRFKAPNGAILVLMTQGDARGWLMSQRPDGSLEPLRKATNEQVKAIYDAACASQGGRSPGRKTMIQVSERAKEGA